MPFEDPFGQTLSPLDWERRMYAQTQNPLHVWRALELCLEVGSLDLRSALPDWVIAYLQRVIVYVREFGVEAYEPDEEYSAALAAVLQFKETGQGKRKTAHTRFSQEHREMMLAVVVRRERRLHPEYSLEIICAAIAATEGVSADTVRRAWQFWRAFLDEDSRSQSDPPSPTPTHAPRKRLAKARRKGTTSPKS